MKHGAILVPLLLLAGCVRTQVHEETPALLAADAGSHAALQAALQQALGRPVTLAEDALTRDSTLFVEPAPLRKDGQRVDGRETRPPEKFTLLRSGEDCLLLRESSERIPLHGAHCRVP